MAPQDLVIREAVETDAHPMGLVHVRAWQSAYRGVMPDQYLDGLQAAERTAMWRSRISRMDLPPTLYESEGWTADGGISTEDILGVTVTDIRYRKRLLAN